MRVSVLLVLDQLLKTRLDMWISRVQTLSLAVCIQCIGDLVVARLVQCTQIVPDFTDVRVQADGSGVGIKSITVLRNLVIEHTNRAPESGVTRVAVHGLLERLVGSIKVTADHVHTTQVVPRMGIRGVNLNRLSKVFQCNV